MSLADHLAARIQADGPMSVAAYMGECLLHPQYGYYTTRDPLGAKGDFTTASEISQMYGELIGLALAQCWLDQGAPAPFTLAELGPGRGTLMADLLRATRGVPGFHAAMQIKLIEASPKLRSTQARTLEAYAPEWLNSADALPDQPLLLVANEFFDALPIRQFIRSGDNWSERRIGLTDGRLAFGLSPAAPQPALDHRLQDTQEGDLVEICDAAAPVTQAIASRIAAHGGAALIVDYGDWRALGDTLQALRAHKPADPLLAPGEADLTAHVDFEALAIAAKTAGCAYTRLTPQGVFLERLGITDRARALAAPLQGEPLDSLIAAHRRLTHPDEMGNLFKVLGLYPSTAAPLPGLNP
ncbi:MULTISPECIES: class I SAM-dependent methyltransferase [unclassified Leisingera]|uniref:class I SAM-dependent methyltransferase n=1 Tax=unclassified Leisingera TaxID=2614906 RepID=UPI00101161F5|nr:MULTISPECIES: SAM-dependent methyltransferase [unclassified Leisingera]MCF6432230.1 SAM-dependent methyltransferase [Leisingera sp. MMG026]QAX28978.1 class I SAM-dependent methyltransferase [Leisingera sp. NJS204]